MATFIGQGTVLKQGMTTYQYGDFILIHPYGHIICAMRNGKATLEEWVGKYVEIKGATIPGYPIDGGPEFVEVDACERILTTKSVGS
jgi:hypothetical protein